LFPETPFRLKNQGRTGVAGKPGATDFPEILGQRFLGRIPKQFPSDALEDLGVDLEGSPQASDLVRVLIEDIEIPLAAQGAV
jgi:hypothetical protein